MAPLYLSILSLVYLSVNILSLRVIGFVGIIIGLLNMQLAVVHYVRHPEKYSIRAYHAFIHTPLLVIPLYTFILSFMTWRILVKSL